jgi:hypothetical protein
LELLTPFLNGVISSLSSKSRRLMRVCLVHPTRSDCIRVGFASALFERDDGSIALLSEVYAAVLEACPNYWAVKFAGV